MKVLPVIPTTMITLAVLLATGCEYEAPLAEENKIKIDPNALGLWTYAPNPNESPGARPQMMNLLQFSDTEYLIHYPTGEDGMYFRGYPIQVGDISCVQLKVIGTDEGPLEAKVKDRYQVIAYELADETMTVRTLNGDLFDEGLKTTGDLKKAFLGQKDREDLFDNPGKFKRVLPHKTNP